MTHDFVSALRRATQLVRAGDPAAATQLIQSTLRGQNAAAPEPAPQSQPDPGKRRGLRETLARLASASPAAVEPEEPSLPPAARFERGKFTCAAGSRNYRVFVPNLQSRQPAGLIMMLHGCSQSPVDFATGTDMNRLAQEQGLIVVYPAQSRGANMQSCWNWFAAADQARDGGEPAILAGLALQMQRDHAVPRGRTFVAGLSAGAAMAVILGRTHSDLFAGVGAHSGLPYKAAGDMASAFAAMAGTAAGTAAPGGSAIPTIVFHGTADGTVNPVNGARIAEQARPAGTEVLDRGTINGRDYTRTTVTGGETALEYWRVDGLGHAWSGGKQSGSYTDASGPDASTEMVRFFLDTPAKGR